MKTPVVLSGHDRTWTLEVDDGAVSIAGVKDGFAVENDLGGRFTLSVKRPPRSFHVSAARAAETVWVTVDGHVFEWRIGAGAPARTVARGHEMLTPPMPATVVRINAKPGDRVEAGDAIIVLEAMKMELPIRAPRDATIKAIHCKEGELVQPDTVLVDLA